MVFYKSILPTELWFIIYKIEHMNKLKFVNNQIKTINSQNRKITQAIKKNVLHGGYLFENLFYYVNSYHNNDVLASSWNDRRDIFELIKEIATNPDFLRDIIQFEAVHNFSKELNKTMRMSLHSI